MTSNTSSIRLYKQEDKTSSKSYCAEVIDIDNPFFQIQINQQSYQAKKAFSCLMMPQKGDIVQVAFMQTGTYILSILERFDSDDSTIDLPKQTKIKSSGNITIEAKAITQSSINYELIASKTTLTSHFLSLLADNLYQFSEFNQVKTEQLLKEVSEFEQSITKELRMIIEEQWRSDSRSIHFLTEDDTTIDAKTVSLG